jgi:signal peptidase I
MLYSPLACCQEKNVEHYRTQQIPDPLPEKRTLFRQVIWEILTTLLPAILIAMFINVYVAEAAEIEAGPSMQPNLYAGFRVMTEKITYYLHEPQRGDIVVVERPEEGDNLIKRVIGLPGETIEVKAGHTYINGIAIDEPWVSDFGGQNQPPTQISDGYVYIMGDNRPVSRDSRAIGPVPIDSIVGRAWFVYWPLDAFQFLPSSNP